jgi:protein-disulfide isomerase
MQSRINIIFGAVVVFLVGFLAGLLIGHGVMGGGCDLSFSDGKTLEVRLNELEQKIMDTQKSADHADEILTKITEKKPPPKPNRPDPDVKHEFNLSDAPWKGASDPKVTVVEFTDFQCPFCKRMAKLLDVIVKEYPDDVRLYFKHRVVHPSAMPGHEAAMAAHEQGKFWEMAELIWENPGAMGPETLEGYAQKIGLDIDRFKKGMAEGKYKKKIEEENEEARKFNINATPGVFINGYYESPRPDGVRQKIEDTIKGKGGD